MLDGSAPLWGQERSPAYVSALGPSQWDRVPGEEAACSAASLAGGFDFCTCSSENAPVFGVGSESPSLRSLVAPCLSQIRGTASRPRPREYGCTRWPDLCPDTITSPLERPLRPSVTPLASVSSEHLFLQTFWQTLCREWTGLDRLRLDKFYMVSKLPVYPGRVPSKHPTSHVLLRRHGGGWPLSPPAWLGPSQRLLGSMAAL